MSHYFVDEKDPAELDRLKEQDRYITTLTGTFPPSILKERIQTMRRVLDIGCGPGEFCMRMAQEHPHLDILGVDISAQMIAFAQEQTEKRAIPNAAFQQLDALQPLPFANGSFDYVHLRFSTSWVPAHLYPALIEECKRLLPPRGLFTLCEPENGMTTHHSPATAQGFRWLAQMLAKRGLGLGEEFAVTPGLGKLLKDAGFEHIQRQAYAADASYGTPYYAAAMSNIPTLFQLAKPAIIHLLGVSESSFLATLEGIKQEIVHDDFCTLCYILSCTGEKTG